MKYLLWFYMVSLSWMSLQGQDIHFKHLDMKTGLSSNQVNDIARDHHGFLILATDQGVCQYDGREVTVLEDTRVSHFSTMQFTSLCLDAEEILWIGAVGGLFTRSKTGKIEAVKLNGKDEDIVIRKILRWGNDILFSTSKGWFIKKTGSVSTQPYPILTELLDKRSLSDMSVCQDTHLTGVYDGSNVIYVDLRHLTIDFDIPVPSVQTVESLPDGRLVCGTNLGMLYILDEKNGQILEIYESKKYVDGVIVHKPVFDIRFVSSSTIAYSTEDDGLSLLDLATGKEMVFLQDIIVPNRLSSNQVRKILGDQEGNIYVTSLYHGLDYFNPKRYFIENKSNFDDGHQPLFVSYVNSIAEDDQGKLWIGATDRVIEYVPATGYTQYHRYHERVGHTSVRALLGFKSICLDLKGRVWQGSFKGGIIIYDPASSRTWKLTRYAHQGGISRLPSNDIWFMERDKHGMIWAAHNRGFMKIDPETFEVDSLYAHPVLKRLPKRRGKCILEDQKGRIWFGTHFNGLYRFDPSTMRLDSMYQSEGLGRHCYEIAEDPAGSIYVAHEKGFSIIAPSEEIFHYTTENGLRNRLVEGFLFDKLGHAFIANHNTIIEYDSETRQFKYYDEQFGIGEVSFKANTAVYTKDGQMLWGTETGYIRFDPAKITSSALPQVVTIYRIQNAKGHSFAPGEVIQISTDEALTFEFSSIDLFGSNKITYQYRMHPQTTHWVDLGTENRITFSNLSRGKYTFRVRASTNGSDWIEANISPKVHAYIPWHRNPLYYGLAFTFGIGLIIWNWNQRRSNQLKETRFKQQVTDLEIKAIRAQMNPHFVFNALNSIQYFTYSGNVDKANEYLSDFATLMRLVLQQSKDGYISLENEISLLGLYLKIESLRFESGFDYSILVEDELEDTSSILIPSMVIQPFVENAIKHGLIPLAGHKTLHITFYTHEHHLTCHIRDNGIGLHAAKEMAAEASKRMPHTSMGMQLVKSRLELYAGTSDTHPEVTVTEMAPPETGTLVTLQLPIKPIQAWLKS